MKRLKADAYVSEEPQRRLSPWRVLLALLVLVAVGCSSFFGWKFWQGVQAASAHKPWFAAYVDATATPAYAFEQLGATVTPNVILSFIVSSSHDACTPSWGSVYTMSEARVNLDLDRRIARLRQQGGSVAISFGGLLNDELAVNCTDQRKLQNAYESVVNHYGIDTIDLDLENGGLTNTDAVKRRAIAIAALQKKHRAQGKSLAVWLTLPVSPQGLSMDGTNAIAVMLSHGVDLAGVNAMTMDYGQSRLANQSMEKASEEALTEAHRQLGILYQRAGINLSSSTIWTKIGATPMIGQNDVQNDIFTVGDASKFNIFATQQGVGRMSMWSANRDIQCGENYVDVRIVSDSCSGVQQSKLGFATSLSKGFKGNFQQNAAAITTADANSNTMQPDDPAKSPYQIWKPTGAYLEGTKVVWHHNVYEAKWWTQGDVPDNPVLQAWQTPWQLIGPVLPGEKPIPQQTLPAGTYPVWSGDTEFQAGDRVLFDGVPYQAKWWTKGDSPAASTSNPDNSPWVPLTQVQIKQLLSDIKTSSASADTKK